MSNPEGNRRAAKRWRDKHPDEVKAYRRQYSVRRYAEIRAAGMCSHCQRQPSRPGNILCLDCQEKMNWQARKRKYGITREQFESMLEDQEGRCAICLVEVGLDANVDHDHVTKQVRGLLCNHCNRGIGCFRDSPEALDMAAEYLRKWER